MYTVSLVCTAQICLCYFYVSSLCNSVWFGSGCQGRVFHQPKHPSKPADISAFIAPLAERERLCLCIIHFFLLLFLPFLHLFYISLPFVHRLLVCFASGWVTLRIKNTAPEVRNVEQDISLTYYSEKQHCKLCERGKHDIKNEANLALSFVGADNYKNVSYNCLSVSIKVSFFVIILLCMSVSMLLFLTQWHADKSYLCFA